MGATITMSCMSIMLFLTLSECFNYFLTPPRQLIALQNIDLPKMENYHLNFDRSHRIRLYINILLHHVPCQTISFQVFDSYKEKCEDSFSRIKRHRYNREGKRVHSTHNTTVYTECGSCLGMQSGCCNTCKDVLKAFKVKGKVPPPLVKIPQCQSEVYSLRELEGESCRVFGTADVPYFKGIISLSMEDTEIDNLNFSHTVNQISVGYPYADSDPVLTNQVVIQYEEGKFKVRYFLNSLQLYDKRIPKLHTEISSYERYRDENSGKFPAIYIHYSYVPLFVAYVREKKLLRFAVQLMGILGGIFSLGQLLDSILSKITSKRGAGIV